MKDGRHMLSGEGGTASSPRFKSKRRSEGPDIFKVLKEEEIGQIKILEVQEGSFHKRKFKCVLKRTACLYKKLALDEISEASSEFEEAIQKSKRQAQKSEKHLAFPDASAPVTQTQLCGNHGQFVEASIPDIEEAPVFFSLVNTCHMHTQLCANHGQFVEDFWVKEKAREVYCSNIQRLPTRVKE
ncbi:hypothetical protein ACFX13_008678 [Malus domestica]